MMPCGWCHESQSLTGMRAHATVCPQRGVAQEPQEDHAGMILIRLWLAEEQSGQFDRAAKSAGKSVSEWLRDLGAAAIAPPASGSAAVISTTLPAAVEAISAQVAREALADLLSDNPSLEALRLMEVSEHARTLRLIGRADKDRIENGLTRGLGYMRAVKQEAEGDECPTCLGVGTEEPNEKNPIPCGTCGGEGFIEAPDSRSARAVELAAKIPGLKLGLSMPPEPAGDPGRIEIRTLDPRPLNLDGVSFTQEMSKAEFRVEFPADTPEEQVRSWAEEFARCRKLGDFGAEAFGEATAHIKKWPNGFKGWNEAKQVAWLNEHHPLVDKKNAGWD